ncbi:MAG: hypothetical protein JSW58_09380 [Candidatus Latescibacterota bacterium]|nr:MAG: hypothetical protein JSW58_09380 [Candidatus Latescibacterota bacterium]
MKRSFTTYILYIVLVLALGCSSDPNTPLGSEFLDDGLIQSQPGEVFQDTVLIELGDTSFVVNSAMLRDDVMLFGREDDVETWMIMRVDFSAVGDDTLETVESASLQLSLVSGVDTLVGVFIELAEPLSEPDTLTTLVLADTIPDSTLVNVNRSLKSFPRRYSLPPKLVEDWIKGEKSHNGMAVVLDDPTTDRRFQFATRQNADSGLRPRLNVFFESGDEKSYPMVVDGTFSIELFTSSNLLLSDGVIRRVYVPVDLSFFDPKTLLHDARLVLNTVPLSTVGTDRSVTLYAPKSTNLDDPGVLTGTAVAPQLLPPDSAFVVQVVFPIRNIVTTFLAEEKTKGALVLQYASEGIGVRRSEFFTSSSPDSLKPSMIFTFSSAPEFAK